VLSRLPGRALVRDSLARNSILIMASTVGTSGLGYLFWMLAARRLPSAAIGTATALISAATVLSMVANLGIGHMFIQRLPAAGQPAWSRIVSAGLLVGTASTAVAASAAVAVLPRLAGNFAFLAGAAGAAGLIATAVALTASTLLDFVFVAHRASHGMLWRNLALAAGKLLALGGLTGLGLRGPGAVVLAWTVPSVLVTAHTLRAALPRLRAGFRLRVAGVAAELGAVRRALTGHHLVNLAQAGPAAVLPVLVTARLGAAENAHFYVAWMTASVLFMVSPAVAAALYAERSNAGGGDAADAGRGNAGGGDAQRGNADGGDAQRGNAGGGDAERGKAGGGDAGRGTASLGRAALVVLVVTGAPALVLFVYGGRILSLFSPAYATGGTLLALLVLAAVPDAVTNLAVAHWRSLGNLGRCVRLNALMAAVCLGLTWLWLPAAGIEAAGLAWLAGQSLGALVVGALALATRQRRRSGLDRRPAVRRARIPRPQRTVARPAPLPVRTATPLRRPARRPAGHARHRSRP
jgi:O-antigen/teichoic acid export membrane protein